MFVSYDYAKGLLYFSYEVMIAVQVTVTYKLHTCLRDLTE